MMKKLVGLFLAVLMIVLLVPVSSKADDEIVMLLPDSGEYDGGARIDDFVSFTFNGGRLVYQGREYLIDARFPYYSDRGPVNLPTSIGRDGYEFDGWYESADFTGEPLVTIPQGYHGPKYVWAKWNKVQGDYGKNPGSESNDNPLTGDNNTTNLFLLLMIVSLCTIGAATVKVKKK